MITPPVLAVESLVKDYRGTRAVDGVSFAVPPGRCFGLLGPNGAGKTTVVRVACGVYPASAGRCLLFGEDVGGNPRAAKARIGVCGQENNLDPDVSVFDNLVVFARYFGIAPAEAAARAEELLGFFDLLPRRDAGILELSGGMQRRLVIARALVNRPDLLVLDEPTTGLDPQARHQVWERVEELKRRGMAILLTTHYMEEAARLCDRLAIMDLGRIVTEGAPADLVRDGVGETVIEVADPPEALLALLAERALPHERLAARAVIYTAGNGADLFRELRDRFSPGGIALRMATLEDLFLKLTRRELRD